MSDIERAKKALDIIAKEGDLYDVIAKTRNLNPTYNALARAHVLFFSRILYLGILAKDQIASYFSPVEKVHNAQQEIRKILGFNVDLIKDKSLFDSWKSIIDYKKDIAILYEDSDIDMVEYIANLRKLLSFCILQKRKTIYLNANDIFNLFPGIDLSDFQTTYRNLIVNFNPNDLIDTILLKITPAELKTLINMLSNYRLDKKFVDNIADKIEDSSIKAAVEKYTNDGDILYLTNIVKSRLSLILNSDSSYKSRELGKAYDTISINGEYIQVVSNTKASDKSSTYVTSIYDYLGYQNYNALLKSVNKLIDDKERILIAILYLYLYKEQTTVSHHHEPKESYYDKIYKSYLENKNNKKKPIEGINDRSLKFLTNVVHFTLALYYTAAVTCTAWLGIVGIDVINRYLLGNKDSHLSTEVIQTILKPYNASMDFENSLIEIAELGILDAGAEIADGFSTLVGDVFGAGPEDNKVLAEIINLNGHTEEEMPHYFACEYGASSSYEKGNISYDLRQPYVQDSDIEYNLDEEVLSVKVNFSRKEIKEMVKDNNLRIPLTVYPVDEGYYLSRIIICDDKDPDKRFFVEDVDMITGVTDEERKLIVSIKRPVIYYCYAKDYAFYNSFTNNIHKEGEYLTTDTEEMRKIIAQNLGLNEDASLYDIYMAIKSKDYSKTPFKDAGLSRKIKKMDEKEYIATVASLDSIVCNLAATLAVEASENFIFVAGFYSDDSNITYGEGHAWAMDCYGLIYDVTPSGSLEEEEKSVFDNIMTWAVEAKVPLYIAILLVSLIIYKLFGKKIIFTIKSYNLNKLYTSPNIEDAYALIDEIRYEGMSIPKQRSYEETVKVVANDFEGYTKEELEELLKKLKESQSEYAKKAIKVIKSVPFVKNNEKKLTRKID